MLRFGLAAVVLALLAPSLLGQGWSQSYEKALAAAKAGSWSEARAAFKQAAAYRTEDVSGPTNLPGPATERRLWRGGAPYSPNFLAAYSAYRLGGGAAGSERTDLLKAAAEELEGLHRKSQLSPESFFLLNNIYTTVGDSEKRVKLDERFAASRSKMTWRVDTEAMTPEERAAVQEMLNLAGPVVVKPGEKPGTTEPPTSLPGSTGVATAPSIGTRVPALPTKFAIIIGNSESRIPGQSVPFASDDAQKIRESLVMSAGYPEENVDLVLNATAEQIMASAKAMSERIPQGATVFLYFSGVGANLDGKDYLAGVDTSSPTDSASMASKAEVYRLFSAKGAMVFSFFQVNRPMASGRYFGMEVPLFGSISQCQATMPGESVYSYVRNGRTVGVYTDAISSTLAEFHSNQVPILEFGWQLFYRMRRGGTGSDGGGSRQTPTLPVLTYLASNAPF